MDTMNGVRQRAAMASDGAMAKGDFGVKPWSCHDGDKMGNDPMKGPIGDGARSAGKPVKHSKGKMPAQAGPDHGPHR
jgi:hypothetical protein